MIDDKHAERRLAEILTPELASWSAEDLVCGAQRLVTFARAYVLVHDAYQRAPSPALQADLDEAYHNLRALVLPGSDAVPAEVTSG